MTKQAPHKPATRVRSTEDPRVVRSRAAVLDAAVELLVERGYSSFSLNEIVARTGVAKTTIYRHWDNRAKLLQDVIAALSHRSQLPDTGSLREDLRSFFRVGSHRMKSDTSWTRGLRSLPAMVDAGRSDASVGVVVTSVTMGLLERLQILLERGVTRGEVRPDLRRETVANLLLGATFMRRSMLEKDVDEAYIAEFVDVVVQGVAPVKSALSASRASARGAS